MNNSEESGWTEKRRRNIAAAREWFKPIKVYRHDEWSRAIYFDVPYLEIYEAGADEKKFGKFIVKVTSTFHDPVSFNYLEDAILTAFSFALVSDRLSETAHQMTKRFDNLFKNKDTDISFGIGSLWKSWANHDCFLISTDLMYANDIDSNSETSYREYPRIVKAFHEFLCACQSRGIQVLSREDFDTFSIIKVMKDGSVAYFIDDRTSNPTLYATSIPNLVHAYRERRLFPFDKNDPDSVAEKIDAWFDEHFIIPPSQDQTENTELGYKDGCINISFLGEFELVPSLRIDVRDPGLPNPRVATLFTSSFMPSCLSDSRIKCTRDSDGVLHAIRECVENAKRDIKNKVIAPMKISRQIYRDVYDELVKYLGYRPYYPLP